MSTPQQQEKLRYIREIYEQMAHSPGGLHHIEQLKKEADQIRRDAGRFEPTQAWGELKFADGLERAVDQINQHLMLPVNGKHDNK